MGAKLGTIAHRSSDAYIAARFVKAVHEAGVAQLVEQRIRNAWVGGSNPSTGTNKNN